MRFQDRYWVVRCLISFFFNLVEKNLPIVKNFPSAAKMASTKQTIALALWTAEPAVRERVLFGFTCYVFGQTVYLDNASLFITLLPENFLLLQFYYWSEKSRYGTNTSQRRKPLYKFLGIFNLQERESGYSKASAEEEPELEVPNGSSKGRELEVTKSFFKHHGSRKRSSNFTSLAVSSFFSGYARLAISIIFK